MTPHGWPAHLYAVALRAFPAKHRARYGDEMAAAFAHELSSRRARGVGAALTFTLAAVANGIGAGAGQRLHDYWSNPATTSAVSRLDVVLAWRMLRRYPGLSAVSVFGIAIGIAVAAGAFTIVDVLTDARLPLPDGARLVSLFHRDVASNNRESRVLHDFIAWRTMTSLEDIGVSRTTSQNLTVDGQTDAVTVAEISASAFRMTRVDALRGRHLLPEDEAPSADDALVIGYAEWMRRFGGDRDIIGRAVELGGTTRTIVGVMPEGFAFPVNHGFWVPWRVDASAFAPRSGPGVQVFGRLAPGATLKSAQAELTILGDRASAAWPATHQHLRPRVVPYAYIVNDMDDPENALAMRTIQFALALLLVVVCVNVAILVYARTAARQGEIAVRGALGASRRRIVAQLCVEALTLAAIAATLGVLIVSFALPQLETAILAVTGSRMPFWMRFELSTGSLVYVVVLTLVATAIVGVLPALKATGADVQSRLRTLSAGGGSRMQMGPVWTLLIVAQVGLTVALLPTAVFFTWDGLRLRTGDAGFASREFVTATLAMDRSLEPATRGAEAAFDARFASAAMRLSERLREQAAVGEVTFSSVPAGRELAMVIEAEGVNSPDDPVDYNIVQGTRAGHLVRYSRVAVNYFDAFAVPVLLGRGFQAADTGTDRVLVSRTLAWTVFGAANPLGRRIRYVGRSREAIVDDVAIERWLEIVGVVADFPADEIDPVGRVYHVVPLAELHPASIGVRARGVDPETLAGTLREASAAADPRLQIRDISTAEIAARRERGLFRLIGATVGMAMLSIMILSAAGIYSLMSFTVTRRRREIGIRAALGANRNRLLAGIFARVAAQLGMGATVGLIAAAGLEALLEGELAGAHRAVIMPVVIATITLVGVLAALGPARRGLAIQPIEALREE